MHYTGRWELPHSIFSQVEGAAQPLGLKIRGMGQSRHFVLLYSYLLLNYPSDDPQFLLSLPENSMGLG